MARTFHALAYDIIGMVEGSKPPLADHAKDDAAFTAMIKQILKDLVHTLSELSKAIIQWFAHFLVKPKTEWDFETKHAYYTHMEQQGLRTLQGGERSRVTKSCRSPTGFMKTVSSMDTNPSTSTRFLKPGAGTTSPISA